MDYDTRTKKLSDIQKKRKELRMETLHKSFEEKTGRKIRSVTSVSLGDSGSGDLNPGKAKDRDDFGELKEEKSINDLNSLSTSGPLPVADSVATLSSPLPPAPSRNSDRRFAQTSG